MRRLLSRIALLLSGTLVGLAVAEGAVRLSGHDPLAHTWQAQDGESWGGGCFQQDEDIGYTMVPGQCGTNDLGFPDRPLTEGRRILLLGDSISGDRLYADLTEGLLARRGERVDVVNTGTGGYATGNQVALYERHAPALSPERVLLQFCLNDYTGTPVLFRQGGRLVLVRDRQGVLLSRSSWWLSRSALYRLLSTMSAPAISRESIQARYPGTEAALHRLNDQLTAADRPLTVVVFPYLAPPGKWPRTEQEAYDRILTVLRESDIDHIDLTEDFTRGDITALRRTGAAKLYEDLPGTARTWGLDRPTARLLEQTSKGRLGIPKTDRGKDDPIHPNFVGHALAAQRITRHLLADPEEPEEPAPGSLNSHIMEILGSYPLDGRFPYGWVPDQHTDGVSQPLRWQGTLLGQPDAARSVHCSGITFELYIQALSRLSPGRLAPTGEDLLAMKEDWYIRQEPATDQARSTGPVDALVSRGLGVRIESLEDLQPGDFVQFWRNNGNGHSAVFIEHTRYRDGRARGLVFWSAQGSSEGLGYRRVSIGSAEHQISPGSLFGVRAIEPGSGS